MEGGGGEVPRLARKGSVVGVAAVPPPSPSIPNVLGKEEEALVVVVVLEEAVVVVVVLEAPAFPAPPTA